jgi:hypothetical protein
MPGFFEGLKRMANGQPVFDENDSKQGWSDASGNAREINSGDEPTAPQQTNDPTAEDKGNGVVKGQSSTFPVVVVKRTRTQINGSNQSVYCSIVNNFSRPVEIDEIELAGRSRKLGGYLRPGEEREYLCYNGSRATSEANRVAKLNYKVEETGDYFQSIYDVEFEYGQDKLYSVEELHWRQPIIDIYG